MIKNLALKAKVRKGINRDGKIPAVVYGAGIKNVNLEVLELEFNKLYSQAGETALVDIELQGKTNKLQKLTVLIHDVERDPISGKFLHIDFLAVDMSQKIKANIPIHFVGFSLAVAHGGILVQNLASLEVESLPGDLPKALEIPLEKFAKIGALLKVSEIKAPAGVIIINEPEQVVASVVEPRISDEPAPAETPAETQEAEAKTEAESEAEENENDETVAESRE